jgi:hypothetical protein
MLATGSESDGYRELRVRVRQSRVHVHTITSRD